jgi:hypothetical protein
MSTTAKWPLRPAAAMYRPLEVKSRVYGPKSAHFSEKRPQKFPQAISQRITSRQEYDIALQLKKKFFFFFEADLIKEAKMFMNLET